MRASSPAVAGAAPPPPLLSTAVRLSGIHAGALAGLRTRPRCTWPNTCSGHGTRWEIQPGMRPWPRSTPHHTTQNPLRKTDPATSPAVDCLMGAVLQTRRPHTVQGPSAQNAFCSTLHQTFNAKSFVAGSGTCFVPHSQLGARQPRPVCWEGGAGCAERTVLLREQPGAFIDVFTIVT